MNKKRTKEKKVPGRANKIKWYTVNQVFKKTSKNKKFLEAYREEKERLRLAKTIREMRISKKLTQAAIARKIDLPQSVIARLESGNHGVSVDTLNKVAHGLGKKVELV